MANNARGHLIVFEGLDKAGKSTQCAKLVEHLQDQGRRIKHLRFPNRSTPIGQMIDAYLKGDSTQEDHVIHLLFSANRWEAAAEIESDIASGVDVVLDRYYHSGCVYSAAKLNPSLDLRWARMPEEGLPRPDIVFFLDISPEQAAKRGDYGEERYEKKDMQDRVRNLFRQMAESGDGDDLKTVDGGQAEDKVAQDIQSLCAVAFKEVDKSGMPIRKLQSGYTGSQEQESANPPAGVA